MKNKSLLFLIAAVLFIACEDQDIKDPLTGEWTFKSGTSPIRATFTLTDNYRIPKSEIIYTYATPLIPSGYGIAYSTNNDAFTSRVVPGKEIGLISITSISNNDSFSKLELRGCKHWGVHGVFSVDTIIYKIPQQPADTTYSGSISMASMTDN